MIDGQQRISAVLDFISDKYSLSKNIESDCAGKKFSQLTDNQQDQIRHYSFICEVFYGTEDHEILQIFARLNTHSVKLNAQELRNGKYFGPFKQSAYSLALEHLEFWRRHRIFSEPKITRMAEVELVSELLILEIDGMQDKKKSIDDFYLEYDESFPDRRKWETQFRSCMDAVESSCGSILGETEFRRPPLFYTLFAAVYHRLYGLTNFDVSTPASGKMSGQAQESLGNAMRKLSDIITSSKQDNHVPKNFERFVSASLRQTDNIRPRHTRLELLYKEAFV